MIKDSTLPKIDLSEIDKELSIRTNGIRRLSDRLVLKTLPFGTMEPKEL